MRSLAEHGRGGIATAVQHHGKEMSYNNYLDADAAWNCVNDFPGPTCVIVKHTNPCGVATRDDLLEAYRLAVRADATSAFGGIVAFNRPVDEALARELREFRNPNDGETRMFYEIVVAPGYTPEGLATLQGQVEGPAHPRGAAARAAAAAPTGRSAAAGSSRTPTTARPRTSSSRSSPSGSRRRPNSKTCEVRLALREAREEQRHHRREGRAPARAWAAASRTA